MESVSDQLANLAVIRQLLLQRVAAGESAKLAALLSDIADELERKLAGPPLTEYGGRRLNQAIRELREVVSIPAPDLSELTEIEATWAASTLTTIAIDAALPTAAVLTSIAESSLVQGATIKTWFQRLEESTQFEIERAVRLGVATGETNQQIARRILGIRSDGERGPEVMKRARRDAESITRTAVQTIANDARLATYEANADVLDGVQQVSTLDGRTSDICIACSGKVWTLPDYKPKGHKIPWNGGTPRHWRCRSTTVPVTKSFRELGIDLDELPPGTRASMYGPVAQDLSFDDFLRSQPPDFADEMLGKGRAELWRSGRITLAQLLDARGNPLTLAELRKRTVSSR